MKRRYRAPGRINLIGEHTDYNGGVVLPGAIQLGLDMELMPLRGNQYVFHSDRMETIEYCDQDGNVKEGRWSHYLANVVSTLRKQGFDIHPVELHLSGDLPIGGGLSSSSALTAGFIFALNDIYQLNIAKEEMVNLASKAEYQSGVSGGKMDQYSIMMGEQDGLLFMNCATQKHKLIYADLSAYELVLWDTGVEHDLRDTDYNVRRSECDRALNILNEKLELEHLSQLSAQKFQLMRDGLDSILQKRVRHVVSENERVHFCVEAIQKGKWDKVGEMLYESHRSLRCDYEVSCEELDFIVDWTRDKTDVLGARMMGGGDGGCTIALLQAGCAEQLTEALSSAYEEQFGIALQSYPVFLRPGIRRVE